MRKIFLFFLLQGYIMAAVLMHIENDGVKIPVIFEQDKNLPVASVEFVFTNAGALASKKGGLASLAADLLNEGSKSKGALSFSKELEDRAIELSVNVGNETLVFSIDALKEQFAFALQKLIELLQDPNYTQETLNKIKTKRLGVLARKADDNDYLANINLKELLFANTPLALPRLGTIESIKTISLDDIKKFIESHLKKNSLIVVVGGDFGNEEAKEIAKKVAAILPKGKVQELPKFQTNATPKTKEIFKETKQAYIYFGAPYNMDFSNKKEYVIGKLASFILGGGGFGSRLMEEVRVKRGLAYSAYSRFIVNKTNSYFFGYLQTKVESQKEAIKVVKEVIEQFLQKGVTKEELESAKRFFIGSEPLRNETLSQRVGRAFREYYDGLGLGFSKEQLEIIKNITLDEINNFIKKHQEIKNLSFSIVTKK